MDGGPLLPEELARAQEGAGALLPAHHRAPLVVLQGRSRQDCTHLAYIEQNRVSLVGRMASRFGQGLAAALGATSGAKPLHMLGLLSSRLGDEHRK